MTALQLISAGFAAGWLSAGLCMFVQWHIGRWPGGGA